MKKTQAIVLHLPYDILKEILICVARSSDGAKDLAKAFSVCKAFRQFVQDRDVLRAVAFDNNLVISGRWEMFQLIEGLINRCAQAGHPEAQFILSKIILVSTSQLLSAKKEATTDLEPSSSSNSYLSQAKDGNLLKQNAQVSLFMENFFPDQNNHHTAGSHFNLVRLFLSRAKFGEFEEMQPYVNDYMEYFIGCKGYNPEQFLLLFNELCSNSVEERLELCEGSFSGAIMNACLHAYKYMKIFGLKEARLRMIEVGLEERESRHHAGITTTVEKFDASIKRFKTMRTVVEEVIGEAIQRCSENAEFTTKCLSLLLSYSKMEALIEDSALEWKAIMVFFEDHRADLISKFDAHLSQLTTNNSA